MVERENIDFTENRVDIQIISKINIDTEENKKRNKRNLKHD